MEVIFHCIIVELYAFPFSSRAFPLGFFLFKLRGGQGPIKFHGKIFKGLEYVLKFSCLSDERFKTNLLLFRYRPIFPEILQTNYISFILKNYAWIVGDSIFCTPNLLYFPFVVL